jgi:hypothetical protein
LTGLGLDGAARLAAHAFAARFPHSVLGTRIVAAADAVNSHESLDPPKRLQPEIANGLTQKSP